MVWSKFLLDFNQDGNIALKLSRLEEDLHTPYSRDTGGLGFLQYIDKLAKTFNQLDSLANKNDANDLVTRYSERMKINILNNAFKGSRYGSKVYDNYIRVRDNDNVTNKFDRLTEELNSWYLHSDMDHSKEARRRAKVTTQESRSLVAHRDDDTITECEALINAVMGEARKTGIYFDRVLPVNHDLS